MQSTRLQKLPPYLFAELDRKKSELKAKGALREFVRGVQDLRKKQGLLPDDRVALMVSADENIRQIIAASLDDMKKAVGAAEIAFGATEKAHMVHMRESAVHIDMRKIT